MLGVCDTFMFDILLKWRRSSKGKKLKVIIAWILSSFLIHVNDISIDAIVLQGNMLFWISF